MVSLEVIAILLSGISISASLFYYSNVLANANKTQQMQLETRQAQLYSNIFNTYASKEYIRDFETTLIWKINTWDEFVYHCLDMENNPDDVVSFNRIIQWTEGIGVMARRGLVNVELLFEIMYGTYAQFYEKYEPYILEMRTRWNDDNILQDLTYLYTEMRKLRKKRGWNISPRPSDETTLYETSFHR